MSITKHVLIPGLAMGIVLQGECLKYPPEYFVHYLSECLLLLLQPHSGILRFIIGSSSRVTIMTVCVEGIWAILKPRLSIVIHTGHSLLLPAKLEKCVLLDMKIKGTSVSTSLTVS